MARTKAQKKGDDLEEAVHLIETMILRSNPNTKDATLTIETKKIVTVQGVRSEIDVFISVDLGSSLKLVYIFECKNREETVSKNDITVFNDKIHEVGAQKGYFVAKKYGRDAINKAKRFQRIELLKATDEVETVSALVENFHYVHQTVLNANLSFAMQTNDPQKVGKATLTDDSKIRLGDEELLLSVLGERVRQNIINEIMNQEPTGTFSAGVYPYDRTKKFTFNPNELLIDGHNCSEINAQVNWEAQVIRPRIISKFDIQKRGRVVTVESGELSSGVNIQVAFIEIE